MKKSFVIKVLKEQGILIILVIIFVLCVLFVPSFGSYRNMKNILRQVAALGIISIGLTPSVIAGCIDLSVGSIVSLTGVVALTLVHTSTGLAILVPLLIALVVGFVNGFLTVKFNISSVIITLGTLSILRGISLMYTGGHVVDGVEDSSFRILGRAMLFGIPVYVFIFLILGIILGIILWRTSFGRYVYYSGSNPNVSKLYGVKVNKIRIYTFIISAVFATLAALILCSRLNTASPKAGDGYEFQAITAIVIGGTSMFGGRGSIFKTFLGIFFVGILGNALVLLGTPYAYLNIIKATMMILAVVLDIKYRREAI